MPNIVFNQVDKRYEEHLDRYVFKGLDLHIRKGCLLYTSPSPRD